MVRSGASEVDIADANPGAYLRYNRGIRVAMLLHRKPRNFMPRILWFYGPTGTGKSRAASEFGPSIFWAPTDKFWFDGYDGQETVVLDDYRRNYCTFTLLLKLLDRYAMQVPIKGGYTNFCCRNIIITTPKSIRETWAGRTDESIQQLYRRVCIDSPGGGEFYFGPDLPPGARRFESNYATNFVPPNYEDIPSFPLTPPQRWDSNLTMVNDPNELFPATADEPTQYDDVPDLVPDSPRVVTPPAPRAIETVDLSQDSDDEDWGW